MNAFSGSKRAGATHRDKTPSHKDLNRESQGSRQEPRIQGTALRHDPFTTRVWTQAHRGAGAKAQPSKGQHSEPMHSRLPMLPNCALAKETMHEAPKR
jgi:hypothetical protein